MIQTNKKWPINARLVKRLRIQCPKAIAEWTKLGFIERKKAKQHLQAHGVNVPLGAGVTSIGKTTIPYLNLFCYKLTLGLHFKHLGAPLVNSGRVSATWRRKEDFVRLGLPKEILDMLPRYSTLRQGTWDTSSEFEYRYDANLTDGIFGCFARLRTGLFITGFAIGNVELLPETERTEDWIRPADLLSILHKVEFERRLI